MTDAAFPVPGILSMTTAAQWEDVFTGLGSGVIPGNGSGLAGSLDTSGRNAVIGTGAAIIQAYCKPVSAPTSTPIAAPSAQNRIDRLVLRLDRSQTLPANWIVPAVITGAPGSAPSEPPLTQTTAGKWELPVCSWVSASSGALTGLKDERYFSAMVLAGVSTARPSMPGPGLFYESDTGRWVTWTGTAWQYVSYMPDSWHEMTLRNGFTNNIGGEQGPAYQAVTLNGAVQGVAFTGVIQAPSNPYGVPVCNALPGVYQPPRGNGRWTCIDIDGIGSAVIGELDTGGNVRLHGNFAPGDQIDITGTCWFGN